MRLILSLLFLASCVTKQEIDAALFVHQQIPEEICEREPALKKIGIFRVVDCNDMLRQIGVCKPDQLTVREKLSYCKYEVIRYFAIKDSELAEILKKVGVR